MAKIPVTIVTGFLGAGKTTLIRHVLENAAGRRLALIINEFGDVGVDGTILKTCGIDNCPEENIVELANGCLCCTVADDFIPAMEALLARSPQPDHIIIETSGLALPKPLVKAFDWPEIRTRLTVDGVIAVVDGAAVAEGRFADDPAKLAAQRAADGSIDHENPLEEVFEDQLLCADIVVLNKADLLTRRNRRSASPRKSGRRSRVRSRSSKRARDASIPPSCSVWPPRSRTISPSGHPTTMPKTATITTTSRVSSSISRDIRPGRPAHAPRRRRRTVRRVADEGLRRGRREADAAARSGRRAAIPPAIRRRLGRLARRGAAGLS